MSFWTFDIEMALVIKITTCTEIIGFQTYLVFSLALCSFCQIMSWSRAAEGHRLKTTQPCWKCFIWSQHWIWHKEKCLFPSIEQIRVIRMLMLGVNCDINIREMVLFSSFRCAALRLFLLKTWDWLLRQEAEFKQEVLYVNMSIATQFHLSFLIDFVQLAQCYRF